MVVPLGVVSQETDWQNAKLLAVFAVETMPVLSAVVRGHPALARDEEKCSAVAFAAN
jgi:hypothetical protein